MFSSGLRVEGAAGSRRGRCRGTFGLVAECAHFTLFWDAIIRYRTGSVHFLGLINSATKSGMLREYLGHLSDCQGKIELSPGLRSLNPNELGPFRAPPRSSFRKSFDAKP